MTATPSIDLPGWMAEQLSQASPDLLRHDGPDVRRRADVGRGRRGLRRRLRAAQPGAQQHPQRLPAPGVGHPRRQHRPGDPQAAGGQLLPGLAAGAAPAGRVRPWSSVVATSYLLGVSTRRMEKLVEQLGITRLSKSQVSEMAKDLDAQVEAFRTRPLDAGPYTFVAADALVLKVREGGRMVNVHALLAVGVNADGYREILGLHVTSAEDGAGWLAFFRDLTARGLSGVSWSPPTRTAAWSRRSAPPCPARRWQRCRTHYAANLMSATPKSAWGWVKALLHSVYDQPDADAVQAQFDRILDALADKLPQVAAHLDAARRRHPRVHRLPESGLAADLVQQPPRAAEPGNPPPHRRRRHLPRPDRADPPGRRRPRRATRRMDRSNAATSASTSWPKAGSAPSQNPPPKPRR